MNRRRTSPIQSQRRAVSAVELLVAAVVLAAIVAVAVPMVQTARETSRRNRCSENLRALGVALTSYHDANGSLPPAAVWNTDSQRSLALHFSKRPDRFTQANWALLLLPYTREEKLAEQFHADRPIADERNAAVRTARLDLMTCPADEFNTIENPHRFEPTEQISIEFARGNYAINGGTNNHQTGIGSTRSPTGDPAHLVIDDQERRFEFWGNGVAGFNRSFSWEEFRNGRSTLVALEEIRAGIHPIDPRGVWCLGQIGGSVTWAHGVNGDGAGPNNQWPRSDDILGCGHLHDVVGTDVLTAEEMPCVSYLDQNQQATARSRHDGGVNVLFLDGAVRFLNDDIDPGLWHVLHSRRTPSDVFDGDVDQLIASTKAIEEEQAAPELHASEAEPLSVISNSLDMSFVRLPAGQFTMGVPDVNNDVDPPFESPPHVVRLLQGFWLGQFEVTQKQYVTVMGSNPSWHAVSGEGASTLEMADTSGFPVEQVTWHNAVAFCRKLSEIREEQSASRSYRLPTEAEWEYACRAGTSEPYHWRSRRAEGDESGEAAGIDPPLPIKPVGSYPPNPFELYDMRGNVWEWTADWFDRDYYSRSPTIDPQGPAAGYFKVVRGGDWIYVGEGCHINYPITAPWDSSPFIGFRVVCEVIVAP